MVLLDRLFLGLQQQKISTEDQEMAEDSVPIDASTIQELIKTVKSLQSDMAELKGGSNRDTITHDRLHHLIQIPCFSRHHPHPLLLRGDLLPHTPLLVYSRMADLDGLVCVSGL